MNTTLNNKQKQGIEDDARRNGPAYMRQIVRKQKAGRPAEVRLPRHTRPLNLVDAEEYMAEMLRAQGLVVQAAGTEWLITLGAENA